MKYFKIIIVTSFVLNIFLFVNLNMKNHRMDDALSRHTLKVQGDLVEFEGAITYQMDLNWKNDNAVLEKIEDIKEEITSLKALANDLGRLTKEQEEKLSRFYQYLSK